MSKKRKVRKEAVVVPSSLEEAALFVSKLGEEQRAIEEIELKLNRQIEALKAEAIVKVAAHTECKKALLEGIYAFADSSRDKLTAGGKIKLIQLPSGCLGWRWPPPAVTLRNVAAVLDELLRKKIHKFIRVKREVNK